MIIGCAAFTASAAASILDIKHSITNDNVVPPESFETKTRELEENFYLKHYTERPVKEDAPKTGTAKEYEELLSRLPTAIEMPYNQIVGKFIDMYLGKRRRLVSDMLALHNYYGPMFIEELEREGMPLELQYLPVIESAINPNAVSRAGAAGLWQFMPSTATGMGMEVNSLVDQRRDPRMASKYAAKYFKQLYDIYGDWSLAIAAYNCGPGRVNKALRRAGGGKKDFWEIYSYLPSETRDYVPAFIAANFVMNYHDRYGIRPTLVKRPLVTDTVDVTDRIHFKQIAEVLNIPIEEIRMLNPQFRKDIIPGNHHPYSLTLPKQQCLSYIMSEDAIRQHDSDAYAVRTYVEPGKQRTEKQEEQASRQPDMQQSLNAADNKDIAQELTGKVVRKAHVVGRGENIRDIAKKYGVSATDIKSWNKLRRGKVKEGDELIIEIYEREVADARTVPERPRQQQTVNNEVPARQNQDNASTQRKRYSTPSSTASRNNDRRHAETAKASSKKNKKAAEKKVAKPKNYAVKSGDNLEKIAKRNGVTVDELRKANGMSKNSTMIREGQNLKIPSKASAKASSKSSAKSKSTAKTSKSKNSSKSTKKSAKSNKKRR